MSDSTPITVAHGDGIGPEIMEATLEILSRANAKIAIETISVGEQVYLKGNNTGIPDSAWDSINHTKILLKAPITTPIGKNPENGKDYKSLNVTMRKALGLYANIRPCLSYHPYINTKHPKLDIVIVRENEEDLYAGIEHRQTHDMYQTLKLISRTGSEKIIRYAFEYAVKNNRKKVTCFHKANIMKFTDGVFLDIYRNIAKEYPNITPEEYIIDIGTARLANKPEAFDVIVTSNLYGDIISDVVAEISGSVGLAGSANIGPNHALFEAIHGSAPDIAGKDMANPSGLIQASVMMLVHIGQASIAEKIQNALLKTLEDGIHTGDIYKEDTSTKKVGTREFTQAVIANLGKKPAKLKAVKYEESKPQKITLPTVSKKEVKTLVGCDVFFDWIGDDVNNLAQTVKSAIKDGNLDIQAISCKGLKVWPGTNLSKIITDHYCVRLVPIAKEGAEKSCSHQDIALVLNKLAEAKLDFIKTENLYGFDGKPGFTLSAGE